VPAPKNNYRRGAAFERKVRDHLYEQGFTYVVRSAGSHGLADLVAMRRDMWLLVQCKIDGNLPPTERELLVELADDVGARAVMAARGKRGKIELHKLAGKDGEVIYEELEL